MTTDNEILTAPTRELLAVITIVQKEYPDVSASVEDNHMLITFTTNPEDFGEDMRMRLARINMQCRFRGLGYIAPVSQGGTLPIVQSGFIDDTHVVIDVSLPDTSIDNSGIKLLNYLKRTLVHSLACATGHEDLTEEDMNAVLALPWAEDFLFDAVLNIIRNDENDLREQIISTAETGLPEEKMAEIRKAVDKA